MNIIGEKYLSINLIVIVKRIFFIYRYLKIAFFNKMIKIHR